jgi:hypothetical protein
MQVIGLGLIEALILLVQPAGSPTAGCGMREGMRPLRLVDDRRRCPGALEWFRLPLEDVIPASRTLALVVYETPSARKKVG